MVATRSSARQKAAAEAPAPAKILKAPPKRAVKKAAPKTESEKKPTAAVAPKPKLAPKKAAPAPKPDAAATTKRTTRATVKNAEHASPLKKPARKPQAPNTPLKRAPRKMAKHTKIGAPVERNSFGEFPNYPSTPAHITTTAAAPQPASNPFVDFPTYPSTPVHISKPTAAIQPTSNPFVDFPTYPSARSHITVPAAVAHAIELPMNIQEDVNTTAEEVASQIEAIKMDFTITELPNLAPPTFVSPVKSAMRSPQKLETTKKSVTWNVDPYSAFDTSLLVTDGPLSGTTFFMDIQSNGKRQNHLFIGLLEDLGAKVIGNWLSDSNMELTHVLFKDGSPSTLQKVAATRGAVKCVNLGWVLDCEKNNKRMDEADYLVVLNAATVSTPAPEKVPCTPARTPSKFFAFNSPSSILSTPNTPNSSEWERSITYDELEDKENVVPMPKALQQTCPPKPQQTAFNWLKQSPFKSSSVFSTSYGSITVARPSAMAWAARKRQLENFRGITMAPPKRPRFN